MPTFIVVVSIMISLTATLLLFPTLRAGRNTGRARGLFIQTILISLGVPAVALAVYLTTGTPQAINSEPAARNTATKVSQALDVLRANALAHPTDVQAWLSLGRASSTMGNPGVAVEAYGKALALDSDNPDIMVAYVEASVSNDAQHRVNAASRTILERALRITPTHQHGLLLLGFANFQDGKFSEAATVWQRLLELLPPGSPVAIEVKRQIADAEVLGRSSSRGAP